MKNVNRQILVPGKKPGLRLIAQFLFAWPIFIRMMKLFFLTLKSDIIYLNLFTEA